MSLKFNLVLLVFLSVFINVKCYDLSENIDLNGIKEIFLKPKLDEIEAFLTNELQNNKIDCVTQLVMIVQGLQKGELWALKCKIFKFNR